MDGSESKPEEPKKERRHSQEQSDRLARYRSYDILRLFRGDAAFADSHVYSGKKPILHANTRLLLCLIPHRLLGF